MLLNFFFFCVERSDSGFGFYEDLDYNLAYVIMHFEILDLQTPQEPSQFKKKADQKRHFQLQKFLKTSAITSIAIILIYVYESHTFPATEVKIICLFFF